MNFPWSRKKRKSQFAGIENQKRNEILPEFPSLKRGGGYARGRGRVQRQIVRAFMMTGRSVLGTDDCADR
jgi:hypothetical protein